MSNLSSPSESPEFIYSFFCEFIREEPGGKTTAIGIFGNRMVVSGSFPILLPGIGFHAFIKDSTQDPLKGTISIKLPGMDKHHVYPVEFKGDKTATGHNLNVQLGGVILKEPGIAEAIVHIYSSPEIHNTTTIEIVKAK